MPDGHGDLPPPSNSTFPKVPFCPAPRFDIFLVSAFLSDLIYSKADFFFVVTLFSGPAQGPRLVSLFNPPSPRGRIFVGGGPGYGNEMGISNNRSPPDWGTFKAQFAGMENVTGYGQHSEGGFRKAYE